MESPFSARWSTKLSSIAKHPLGKVKVVCMYAAECRYVLLLLHHIDLNVAIGQIHIEIKGQRRF